MKPDPCRFCRLYAVSVLAFAGLIGVFTTLSYVVNAPLGLGNRTYPFLTYDVIRSGAPAASGSALLLALVLWSHPLSLRELQQQRPGILWRASFVALPGYLVAAVVAIACGFAILLGGYGRPSPMFELGFGLGTIRWQDFSFGAGVTLVDTMLIVFLAHRYLERMHAGRMNLPQKLIVVVTVTVGLRATVGLVFASLLSG